MRGGVLRVRGAAPLHFDPHLTGNVKTHTTLSFVYSKLVRYQIGAGIQPGTFRIEPDLAERWENLDDTTYVFHLCKGVKWHHKPRVNGRELVAEDVKITFDRFLTEQANPLKFMLDHVDRVEVLDRYDPGEPHTNSANLRHHSRSTTSLKGDISQGRPLLVTIHPFLQSRSWRRYPEMTALGNRIGHGRGSKRFSPNRCCWQKR